MTHENSDNVVLLDDNVESDHIVLLENNVKSDHIDYVPSGQAIELTADKILDKKLEGWLIEIDDEEEGRGYEPDEPYYQVPIPLNSSTCSDVNRPLIPLDCVQGFQCKSSS